MFTERISNPNECDEQAKNASNVVNQMEGNQIMLLWMKVMKLVIFLIFHSKINYNINR